MRKKLKLSLQEINSIVPKSKRAKETFLAFVKCAQKLFAEQGYIKTTVEQVAKDANLSVGCFYKYFSSKYELYVFILDQYRTDLGWFLYDRFKNCTTEYERQVAYVKAFIEHALTNPACYNIVWESLYIDRDLFFEFYEQSPISYINTLKLLEHKDIFNNNIDILSFVYASLGAVNFLGIKAMLDEKKRPEQLQQSIANSVKTMSSLYENGLFNTPIDSLPKL